MPSPIDASLNDPRDDLPEPSSARAAWPGPAPAGVALWQHDTATGLVHSDAAGWGLLGLPPAPQGLPLATLVSRLHPEDRASVDSQWAAARPAPDHALRDLGARLQHADGRWRYLLCRWRVLRSAQGQVTGQSGVALDLTERFGPQAGMQCGAPAPAAAAGQPWPDKRDASLQPQQAAPWQPLHDRDADAQAPLREANARSALATRGAGIGTWESDAGAQAGWWDEQMFHLRGLPPLAGLVQTRDMLQWLHPEDRAAYQRQLQDVLARDAPSHTEFRIVRPDGQVRWLSSRSVPVRNEQGLTVRRIGINWDNTDAHLAALARDERQLALRENQAKSRALARISHELRTPLNAVLGFSQLLLTDGPDPANWRERVGHVQRAGQQLLKLVNDVLELSGRATGESPLQAAQAPPPPAPGPQASLLYIEDNEVNLLIVEALMHQRPDLRFLSACDGLSGVAVAQTERPCLILVDMQLPDIDGDEVLRRLRADPATAAIHCIALSANAMPEDIRAALQAGFDAYWTKPLDIPAFLQALAQHFGPAPH